MGVATEDSVANVTKKGRGRRGGRRPGLWTVVTKDEIRSFREAKHVSRAVLAKALGCSATSIQNWETGNAIPTPKNQEDLRKIMDDPRGVAAIAADPGPGGHAAMVSAVAQATATIVAGVFHGHHEADPAKVAAMVAEVRKALEGRA